MKRTAVFAALALLISSAAGARPTDTVDCAICHQTADNVLVTMVPLFCNTTTGIQFYTLSVSNTNPGAEGWGVFDGATKVRSGYGNSTTSSMPGQATYTFYGVSGFGSGSGLPATSNSVSYTAANCPQPPPPPLCTDLDHDNFKIEGGACGAVDCNDNSYSIHPGAIEVIRDGIDQDCNGYDNTIRVPKATWSAKSKKLTVEASSLYGSTANLVVAGIGPNVGVMTWNSSRQLWTLTAVTSYNPGTVSVQGVEGSLVASVTQVK